MAIGISNRWPPPPDGFVTTQGVVERGQAKKARGELKFSFTQPQVLLMWINAPLKRKRAADFPCRADGRPYTKRDLKRGPGPRGGRLEWPELIADDILGLEEDDA